MMPSAVGATAAVIWFVLNGLLWYARLPDLLWLLGSAILGLLFFVGFFGYLTAIDRLRSAAGPASHASHSQE
jgi:hypothetical protein